MTTKDKNPQIIDLDKLIKEKLSQRTLNDIEYIKIEISEVVEPGLSLKVDKKNVEFRFILKTSTRKLLKWLGGLTAIVSGMIALLKWLIPILTNYLPKPPP